MSDELRGELAEAVGELVPDRVLALNVRGAVWSLVAPLLAEKDAEIARAGHETSVFRMERDHLLEVVVEIEGERDAARAELEDLKAKAGELLDAVAEPHEFNPPEACNEVEGEDLNYCLECSQPRAAHTLAARLMEATRNEVRRMHAELQRVTEVVSDDD
jgi:hypothetical protein